MYEKTLPIGSVVLNKGGSKKVMIVGYYQFKKGDNTKIYDYVGVIFPEGYMSAEYLVLFDHENIERIYSLGFQDQQRIEFEPRLRAAIEKSDKQYGRS